MNKDLILKKGDMVTYKIKNGRGITNVSNMLNGQSISAYEKTFGNQVIKVERPVKYKTIYEVKEILDEVEKKWLGNFVKPFRSKIYDIVKYRLYDNSGEWLQIRMKDSPDIDLPYFKLNKMYKGMKINREYTLEELGL